MRLSCLLLVCWMYGSQAYPILVLLYIKALAHSLPKAECTSMFMALRHPCATLAFQTFIPFRLSGAVCAKSSGCTARPEILMLAQHPAHPSRTCAKLLHTWLEIQLAGEPPWADSIIQSLGFVIKHMLMQQAQHVKHKLYTYFNHFKKAFDQVARDGKSLRSKLLQMSGTNYLHWLQRARVSWLGLCGPETWSASTTHGQQVHHCMP